MIFSNRRYAILDLELQRVGAVAGGDAARSLLDLSRPDLDFTALARGMGVPAARAAGAGEFAGSCAARWPSRARTSSRRVLSQPG